MIGIKNMQMPKDCKPAAFATGTMTASLTIHL